MAKKGAKGAAAAAAAGGATVAAKKSRGEGINTKLALVMKSGKVGHFAFTRCKDDNAHPRTHSSTHLSHPILSCPMAVSFSECLDAKSETSTRSVST